MKGLIGKKVGMTSIFDEKGNIVPVTVIEAGPNVVTQVRTQETDGYTAHQLSYGERKEKNTPAGLKGHFAKADTTPKTKVVEFRDFEFAKELGESVTLEQFQEGDKISVIGISKGKGFQGVVKRHGFSGVGMQTHGQHNRQRHAGSIGSSSFPSRVFPGTRMSGRMGTDRVKVRNLKVVKILSDKNLILIKGAVPGHNGSYVIIEKK
jgi:large subunit ribosomal protein L3